MHSKQIRKNERWEGHRFFPFKVLDKQIANTTFDDLVITEASISNVSFERCDFKNCYIGFDVTYTDCSWMGCKFQGKYSSLGSNAKYINCKFSDVLIRGMEIMNGTTFIDCTFSGKFENMVLRGGRDVAKNQKTSFVGCDLSNVDFRNVTIAGNVDLASVKLPKSGIRIFNNDSGKFTDSLRIAASEIEGEAKIPLEVYGIYSNQNPMVIDIIQLNDMLDTDAAKNAFEKVATSYEIT